MRMLLVTLLVLGLMIVALSQFQRASQVARWSQIYGLLGATPNNPLEDQTLRKRFDALYFQDASVLPGFTLAAGLLESTLSIAALLVHPRHEHHEKG